MHYRVRLADVIAAHDEALTYGGRAGVVNLGGIESAISLPYAGYHRSISRKAAALLRSLVQNHGFVDGNKRTALLITDLFIRRSGYHLNLDPKERFDDLIVDVASGRVGFDELVPWFKARLVRR
ncbi:MAG: type II toxin-antitoxin system death-on-curing family toxin [Limimaricola sp.]|uniref:type II toxin-antitoxin system death-on-curing family toxin n=1 Tax=Limimaricola sp. TaxID=2211665 RepID=UPI001D259214|nr:type II toxin-antitoxin system death-on-curing family toxin [Limimaricola sp.]MBI1416107.1 type II toxin-antitoxin system death-on-curing family toxin [Limimaricola sp.]